MAVLDYGAANMVSITKALAAVGADVVVAPDPEPLATVDALVVPGVGAAGPAMAQLDKRGLRRSIVEWVQAGRPLLGICLGFQILFDASDEGDAATLGLLRGRTERLDGAPTLPHIGWNSVEYVRAASPHPLFEGVADGSYFYFVHSYAPVSADESIVIARTTHGRSFASAVVRDSLVGLQFHPEKSAEAGLRVLANFVRLAAESPSSPAAAGLSTEAASRAKGAA